jgi:hypothetical protein
MFNERKYKIAAMSILFVPFFSQPTIFNIMAGIVAIKKLSVQNANILNDIVTESTIGLPAITSPYSGLDRKIKNHKIGKQIPKINAINPIKSRFEFAI